MKVLLYAGVFMVLSYIQTIVSMYRLKDQPTGDLTYNFFTDVFVGSIVAGLFYMLFTCFIVRIKNFNIQLLIHGILASILWFLTNLSVFLEREASWSTYTLSESVFYTLNDSCIMLALVLVVFCITLFCYNRKESI